MNGRIGQLSAVLLWGSALLVSPVIGFAQVELIPPTPKANSAGPVSISPSDVKRLFVPADRPKEWPQGDWQAIEKEEFQRLLKGLEPETPIPPPAKIQKARYQAVFDGKQLTAGRLEAKIRQLASEELLSLEPSRLAVTSLAWEKSGQSEPALWGHAADGRMLLVLPRASNQPGSPMPREWNLKGEWNAAGHQHSKRVEFDLQLLPAAINEMELLLPADWTPAASAGQVAGPLPATESSSFGTIDKEGQSGLQLWRVTLGSLAEFHLTLNQTTPSTPAKPLVLAESDTTYVVEERELQVEARYELEVAFAPISQIVFEVPRGIEIFSVTYGGDANLSWRTTLRGARQQVVLELPDPLLGKSRPIRIQGLGSAQLGRAWRLPPVTCSEASLLRGELHLTVRSPLEIRSYELAGFRQTSISVEADVRETLTFAQIAADRDAVFTAYIGTPPFSASAQIVSDLSTGTEEWLMQSEIAWSAQTGSRFIVSCDVLPDWEILDVRRAGSSTSPVISDWRVSRPRNGTPGKLTIEFLEALTAMQNKRVLVLARRLPLTAGQTMSLASLEPLACRSVEQFLAVHSESEILASASSPDILRRKGGPLPGYVQSSSLFGLFDPAKVKPVPQFFHSKSPGMEAELTINGGESPYKAGARVFVEFGDGRIEETVEFSIEPLNLPVDRFSFLAPDLGEGWQWKLAKNPSLPIQSPTKSPAEANGEMSRWEIRLPAPQTKPFQIRGTRISQPASKRDVILPVLPAAQDFQGVAELKVGEGVSVDVGTIGMQEEPGDLLAKDALRRWRYQSSKAGLVVERLASAVHAPAPASELELLSLINGYNESALHLARFKLAPSGRPLPFRFRFPEKVRLIEVRMNGELVEPRRSDDAYVIPAVPANQKNQIEVRYESPWEKSPIASDCPVPIPETELSLLDCRWRFALSPNLSLAHAEGAAVSAIPKPHWTTRFFGPLGRGTGEEAFRPWQASAWESLMASPSRPDADAENRADAEFFPPAWTIHEARGPAFAGRLKLSVWHRSQGTQWAWIALLASLITGFVFRLFHWKYRRHVGVTWFLLSLMAAGFLPMPWAMIAGAALVGTLISFLFPRRLLFRPGRQAQSGTMLGSTATFHNQPVVSAVLLVAGGLGLLAFSAATFPRFAQGQPPALDLPTNEPAREIMPVINVMIPVDDSKKPRLDSDLVYVDRKFLADLRAAQPKPPAEVRYLLNRADYKLEVDREGAVDVTATFQVVVLDPDRPATVRLPIDHAFLGGPGHCEVDGVSHPVLVDAVSDDYLVELKPRSREQTARPPAVAEKRQSEPATRQILLRMHGVASVLPNGGQYSISVPPIANSQVDVTLPEAFASIALRSERGERLSSGRSRSFRAPVGSASKLDVLWSQEPTSLDVASKQRAEVFALATIHALRVEWQIRMKSGMKTGRSSATWLLPAGTIVRDVKSERLESYHVLRQGNLSRLVLEFQKPLAADLAVDVTCMTPRDLRGTLESGRIKLPALDLFGTQRRPNSLIEADYQIGVASTPELAIGPADPAVLTERGITAVPPDKFLAAYRQSALTADTLRTPQSAFRLAKPAELEFPIRPRLPSKLVRLNQTGRIRERELEWTLSAEIETSAAAAFRHVLSVPADLAIESISVREDETERLVRWSRSGSRVELVLSDGTTGTQKIELAGRMPIVLAAENRIPLPLVGVESAETADSRLLISLDHDASHHVVLSGIEALSTLETRTYDADQSGSRPIAGVRLNKELADPILVVTGPVAKVRFDQAVFFARERRGQARLTALLQFKNLRDAPRQTTIRIPPDLTREFLVSLTGRPGAIVPYETITQADQSLYLVFHSKDLMDRGGLQISAAMEPPPAGGREIPQIQVVDGELVQSLLLMSREFEVQSAQDDQAPIAVRLDDLPEWIKQAQSLEAAGYQIIEDPSPGLRLVPAPSPGDSAESEASVHTKIWLTVPGRLVGRTTLRLPANGPRSLTWLWPPETTLQAAVLDGEPVNSIAGEEAGTLRFLIPPVRENRADSEAETFVVFWSEERNEPVPRFGQLEFSLPKPRDLKLETNTLDIVPPRQIRLIAEEGVEASDRAFSHNGFAGNLDPADSNWSLAFWTMDSRAENALLMCLVVLVLAGLMYWGLRLETGDWLHRHLAVSFGLIGILWWTCLAGSSLGFAVFVLSPLLVFVGRRKPAERKRTDSRIQSLPQA